MWNTCESVFSVAHGSANNERSKDTEEEGNERGVSIWAQKDEIPTVVRSFRPPVVAAP